MAQTGAKLKITTEGLPTAERFLQSDGHVEVGGDDRATRVYRFEDTALARVYSRLKAHARTSDQRDQSEREERALERYFVAYIEGGLNGSVGSSDFNGTGSSNPAGRDHAAKTDFQVDKRAEFRRATIKLTDNQREVCKLVVLSGCSLEDAGRSLGKLSQRRAIQSAEKILREAGSALVDLWS